MFIKNRREVERLDHLLDLYLRSVDLRRTVMQFNHDARKPLLPERHQHAPANDRLHARWNERRRRRGACASNKQQDEGSLVGLLMGPVAVYQIVGKVDIFQNLTQYLRV